MHRFIHIRRIIKLHWNAYILGEDEAIEKFTGKIIAVVHRNDDVEEKWVVAPAGMTFTKEEIREQIHFQE